VTAALAAMTWLLVASAADAQPIKIRLANAASPPHPFYKAGEMFKEGVEKGTGGKVEVQYLHSRQLGEDRQIVEGVMAGTIDATVCSTITMTVLGKKTSFEALQLPFLVSSYDNFAKVLTSPAAQALLEDLSTVGVKGLTFFEGGLRHFLSARGPVTKVDDFKGLKVRVIGVPLHLAIWQAAGTAPVAMNYGEIYTSLQTRVIDAVEINVSSVESEKFWEPAKHFTYTGHYFWPGAIIYNKAKFEALPADVQRVMIDVGRELTMPQVMATKNAEAEQVDMLKKKGVQFHQFTELPRMRELMKPLIEQRMARDKNVAAFVETVRKIETGN
jgi:tripartite ATP-independent transporter DctP family solute receptor